MVLCTVMLTWGYYVEILHHPSSTLLPFLLQACSLLCVKFGSERQKKKFPILNFSQVNYSWDFLKRIYVSVHLDLRVWTFSAVCHLIFILLTPYGRHDMKSAVMFLLPVFCNFESQPIALWQCQFSTLSALNQICILRRTFLWITNYWYRKWWIFGTKNFSLTLDLY